MRTFISYSHRDENALDRLCVHLTTLKRDGYITEWSDRMILAGDDLDDTIEKELENADIFLLLVSPDFIASDYCVGREMRRALERHKNGQARVVPIIVEPCDWKSMDNLCQLRAIPKDGRPISKWPNPNDAYLDIAQELRRIIDAKNSEASAIKAHEPAPATDRKEQPKYKAQREFDEIDRSEFRDEAFLTIKNYFEQKVLEINFLNGLRGRFVVRSATSFGATIVNRGIRHGTAHITVNRRSSDFPLGDIYYSFTENAPENSANGWFHISSDDYKQFLAATTMLFGTEPGPLNPDQAAEYLWNQFIKQAGIDYA